MNVSICGAVSRPPCLQTANMPGDSSKPDAAKAPAPGRRSILGIDWKPAPYIPTPCKYYFYVYLTRVLNWRVYPPYLNNNIGMKMYRGTNNKVTNIPWVRWVEFMKLVNRMKGLIWLHGFWCHVLLMEEPLVSLRGQCSFVWCSVLLFVLEWFPVTVFFL